MFKLTGFGDEVSPHLQEQLALLASEGVNYLELRSIEGRSVVYDLTDEELQDVKAILNKQGFRISAIASPIGKIRIDEDFKPHLEQFKKAMRMAHLFETPYVRIFSYYPPDGQDIKKYRDQVLERMGKKVRLAEKEDIILLSENGHAIYGQTPQHCLDILKSIDSPNLRCLFDPGNFILDGMKPYDEAYPLLADYIDYLHIKDANYLPGKMDTTLPGRGQGQIREVLSALGKKRFDGFLSLEPHLTSTDRLRGFSGPELFAQAIRSLKQVIHNC